MSNYPRVCRVCMSDAIESQSVTLFNGTDETRSTRSYVSKIEECTGIKILPIPGVLTLICEPCVRKLLVAHNFRVMFQGNNATFIDMYGVDEPMKMEVNSSDSLENEEDSAAFDVTELNNDDTFAEYLDDMNDHRNISSELIVIDDEQQSEEEEESEKLAYGDEAEDCSNNDGRTNEQQSVDAEEEEEEEEEEVGGTLTEFVTFDENVIEQHAIGDSDDSDYQIGAELNKSSQTRRRNRTRLTPSKAHNKSQFMCDQCGNGYSNQSTLKLHMRRHLAVKPYGCEICSKNFAGPSELTRHMRVHSGDKPYKCQYCDRTFADRSSNIRHERTHTNERPYECTTCHKTFAYSNVLKNHELTHSGEKSYTCDPCDRSFSRKHQLIQHFATITHKERLVKADEDQELCLSNMPVINKRRKAA